MQSVELTHHASKQWRTRLLAKQNFAKAFEIKFADKDGTIKYPWQNSWGVSTRMMGALIMTHSDDKIKKAEINFTLSDKFKTI